MRLNCYNRTDVHENRRLRKRSVRQQIRTQQSPVEKIVSGLRTPLSLYLGVRTRKSAVVAIMAALLVGMCLSDY
jgi:hypothetical protein